MDPTVLLKKNQRDQVAQVQLHFAFLCRRSTASLSNPGLCLTNLIMKKEISDVQREHPLFRCVFPASCTDTWCHWKCSGFIFFFPVMCLHVPGRCPWAFSVVWEKQHFLNLSLWRISRKSGQWPLNTSTDLLKNGLKSKKHYCKLKNPLKVMVFSQSHIGIIKKGRG